MAAISQNDRLKKAAEQLPETLPVSINAPTRTDATFVAPPSAEAILCAIRGTGRTLEFALREASETGRRLYLLSFANSHS
jgi:hypothetical protein